jgi:CBS domain containing-hemolysin-like protein
VPTREFLAALHAEGVTRASFSVLRPASAVIATGDLWCRSDQLMIPGRRARTPMIILVDEHGGTEVIVTLRDTSSTSYACV